MSFVKRFSEHLRSYRHDVSDKARQYACGLMQAGSRKNMDRMAEVVPEAKSRKLQQVRCHRKMVFAVGRHPVIATNFGAKPGTAHPC
jgi:hypothetical protein